jgi:PHD/YefM family antitoxin component YafN of YafNO toxin-antitoxin module
MNKNGAVQKHGDTVIERRGEPSRTMIPKELYRDDLQWFTSILRLSSVHRSATLFGQPHHLFF